MKKLMQWLGLTYASGRTNAISKELSTMWMALLVLFYAAISDILRVSSETFQLTSPIVILSVVIVLLMIKYNLLILGQFLLFFTGLLIGFTYFPYNESFNFYTQMALVLIISAIIHVRPYQMHLVNIIVNGLVILRTFYLYRLNLNAPLAHNIFEQSIFVVCGIIALTLLVNRLIVIIDNETYETNLLKGMAELDVLTGLNNRSNYNKEMVSIYDLNQRVHLAIIDIDDFKRINDEFGHDVGDYVLISLSNQMKQWFAEECFRIYRWGGEEFVIIASEVDIKDFISKLENFRLSFNKTIFQFKRQVTFSVGVATRDEHEKPGLTFVHADQALYVAKHAGKNRTKYWEITDGEIV